MSKLEFAITQLRTLRGALNIAIEALKEKRDREQGCPYCTETSPLPDEGAPHENYIRGKSMFWFDHAFGFEGIHIRFCPMCGRRLEVHDV